MLLGINEIEFYENASLQRYANFDVFDQMVKYATNTIPPFVLISDTSETTGTVQVFNSNDNAVGAAQAITISTNEDAKQLLFTGASLSGNSCGFYYLKITVGSTFYYSEYFNWVDDVSDLLKLDLNTIGDSIINNKYTIDTSSLNYTSYWTVPVNDKSISDIELEITEEGEDKNYGTEILSGTTNFTYNLSIAATEGGFKFLAQLRHLEINGTIYLTYQNNLKDVYNFEIEVEQNDNYGERLQCILKYRERLFMTNSNE